jgi:RimJ/RimL family protein N-acetyltransferase
MSVAPAKSAPPKIVLDGQYVRLEPIGHEHAADIFEISTLPGEAERYRYLPKDAPARLQDVIDWIDKVNASPDQYVAVVDQVTGKAVGHQGWLRIFPQHASIEIGGIFWGQPMARSRRATEAFFLFARHAFDELGYRRFEWKCNDLNEPSKAAARRFGFQFEGVFRQDMIVKGQNRNTAWFSIIDGEWPDLRAEYERWLNPSNFDAHEMQKTALRTR